MPQLLRPRVTWFLIVLLLMGGMLTQRSVSEPASAPTAPASAKIDFGLQIRPILSENCFVCHGPDDAQRKAKLRLDTRDGATAKLRGGGHAIVPGKPADSELLKRILTHDAAERMPPAKTNKTLKPAQIEQLKQWIEQGAPYAEHWAFVAPKRPALPEIRNPQAAIRNPIDRFILARLERAGLKQAPEADKIRLLRRVTLDLTGLPPTPAEVDAFLADSSPNAYEKVVERLFTSPHYAERMTVDWLDAARFADTHGYHIDSGRDMTRWREYVIDSFQRNKPFDQFTVEQLAGDLLPGATVEQKIASGFNRNHMINFEGGAIPQEYHTAYIVDRVSTTATVWLGLTVACAQCHDHKYDPISQKEFYQLYAFFNNVPENGLDGAKGNASPVLQAPSPLQQQEVQRLAREIQALEAELAQPRPELAAAQAEWERAALAKTGVSWSVLEPHSSRSQGGASFRMLDDKSLLATGANPATDVYTLTAKLPLKHATGLRLEALPDASFTASGPGRSINGNVVLTGVKVAGTAPVKLQAVSADFSQKEFPVSNLLSNGSGWAIFPEVGKPHRVVLSFVAPVSDEQLTVTLEFKSKFAQHTLGRFRLAVTDAPNPQSAEGLPGNIRVILGVEPGKRTPMQSAELQSYYLTQVAPVTAALRGKLADLKQQQGRLDKGSASTMVMQEMATPRETFLLLRGEYDKKGQKGTAGTPAFLPPLPKDLPANRLALARWLVSPEHPLTARVLVNRYWQMFFGTGLVKTVDDFGSQGDAPSHPELLDWLAVELLAPTEAGLGSKTAWDVRALVRLIVTSATYRQSAVVPPDALAKDADNRLLARSPRLRLQAEFIRDQALAVSGLLDRRIGGASVFPYQPQGLWQELASRSDAGNWSAQVFVQSKGKDLYRRTMYTFWKRASPPPQLLTFDAPDRETCTVKRSRTNTPLQALILLNDPTYVEASRKLAERLLAEAKAPRERIVLAFRLATARTPSEREVAVLTKLYEAQLADYQKDTPAALKLLGVGEAPRDERFNPAELAAWTVLSSAILNLDETLTRG